MEFSVKSHGAEHKAKASWHVADILATLLHKDFSFANKLFPGNLTNVPSRNLVSGGTEGLSVLTRSRSTWPMIFQENFERRVANQKFDEYIYIYNMFFRGFGPSESGEAFGRGAIFE